MEIVKTYNKILMVEDGSVDIDELKENLSSSDIYVLVYRQGAQPPIMLNLKENNNE